MRPSNSSGGRLRELPSWPRWVEQVHLLSHRARAAFEGKENLHLYTADIARLKTTYDDLAHEAAAKGITFAR